MLIEIGFKEAWVFKKVFFIRLFSVFSLIVNKMFIEIRLCDLMTYAFKEHVRIVKTHMVKFNLSILNKLKIMSFL